MKKRTWMRLPGVAALFCLAAVPSVAQVAAGDSLGQERLHRLDEVVVSAPYVTRQTTATSPFLQLSRAQFEQQGVTDIADALRRFSGVNVKDYGGAGGMKTVSVRSLGAQHTAVAYDGITLTDCQSGQIDFSRFSLDNVAVLSLAVGDNDDIFLPARTVASAASIRLHTLRPDFADRPWHVRAGVRTGSFGLANPFARYDGRLGDKTSVSLSGDFMRADNLYPFTLVNGKYRTEERRRNNRIGTWRGEGNLYARPTAHSELIGKVYYYDSFRELPGPVILYNSTSDEELTERNFFTQLHFRTRGSEHWSLQLNGKFNWAYSHYHDLGDEYPGGALDNRYYQREYYASAAVLYTPWEHWAFAYAADYAFNNLTSDATSGVKPRRHTLLQTLSARYRTPRLTLTALLLGSIYQNNVRGEGEAARDARRLSPSVSASWKPWEAADFRLRASYKDIFRVATFTENYFDRWGSRDVRPEVARQFNVGLTYGRTGAGFLESLAIALDGYYNYITDKIVAIPYNMFFWTTVNLGHVDIWGADLHAEAVLRLAERHRLPLSLNYTWQRAVDMTDPTSVYYKDQIPYTPEHSGACSVAWENPWLNVSFHVTGVSERYASVQNIASNRLDGYAECGLALYRTFRWKGVGFSVRGDVQNLGNKQYSIVKSYPMPGRSYRLTISMNL